MPDRLNRRDWVVACVAAVALAIVLTWPWAIELWKGKVSGDAGQFTWNAWWVARQVLSLHNPWWTDYQFAPVGAYLTAHTLDALLFAAFAPLTALIGPIPVYGLTIIGLHAAAAVLMWRLAFAMGFGRVGAATAGILWASSPIVVFKATAHVHQLVLIASLPAAFLLWRRVVRTGRVRDGVILGGTELPLILQEPTYAGVPALDATGIHVEAAIDWLLGDRPRSSPDQARSR